MRKGNMRPICWLHISDIHLRAGNEWSQDVVLKAMCGTIKEQRTAGTAPDFVLVDGRYRLFRKDPGICAGSKLLRCRSNRIGSAKAAYFLRCWEPRH